MAHVNDGPMLSVTAEAAAGFHADEDAVRDAVARCRAARARSSEEPLRDRTRLVRRARARLADRAAELVPVASPKLGSPARALAAEVIPLIDACRFLEREASRILRPRRPRHRARPAWLAGIDLEVRREPHGVVLIIGPSNYPLFLAGVQTLQALVAGNSVVLKPGAGGLPAAQELRRTLLDAGLDAGRLAVLPESVEAARQAIDAGVDKVVLTGAAATGREVLARLAPNLVPSTMELSGCDAVFVRPDADLDLVARAVRFGLALNAGATCIAPRRIFVSRSVAAALEERLARCLAGLAPVSVPPDVAAELRAFVDEALDHGARLAAGGQQEDGAVRPLLLSHAAPAACISRPGPFAPVSTLVAIEDDDEALAAYGQCPYALGASVFGSGTEARALAERIPAGVVVVNDVIVPTADPRLPFGARGASGFGVTRGAEGLLEMTTTKAISIRRRGPWRHLDPESPFDDGLFLAYTALAHGRGLRRRLGALPGLVRGLVARWTWARQSSRDTGR